MSKNNLKNSQLYGKIKNLNNSIDMMLDCVNQLEKMRSYDYMAHLSDEELQVVLDKMEALEKNIEKLRTKDSSQNQLIKAIGKNKRLWVTKPVEKKPPASIATNTFKKPLLKDFLGNEPKESSPFLFTSGARKVAYKYND